MNPNTETKNKPQTKTTPRQPKQNAKAKAIAFEDYLFVVYHFRYPHMAKNEMPQNQSKPYKTKGKGDFWPVGHFSLQLPLRTIFL